MVKSAKKSSQVVVSLDKIVGGGQAIGTLEDGRKAFVWGGLPGETVKIKLTKRKSNFVEGVVVELLSEPSPERAEPADPESYLSTSPWQLMNFEAEQNCKSQLITDAFNLHHIQLEKPVEVYSDSKRFGYRNKIEFSFWFDLDSEKLALAFFRRGGGGKVSVDKTSLAHPAINQKAQEIVEVLNKLRVGGRDLKTLLIRSDAEGKTAWQLYVKTPDFDHASLLKEFDPDENGEVIFSNPKSPASVITKRLGGRSVSLQDAIMGVPFNYATEGFFQINLPVYQKALADMQKWIPADSQVLDLYSGVGSIGLTIGGEQVTLVEVNESAVREMQNNIDSLGVKAQAVLAPAEKALDYISGEKLVIVDPPRAGLHKDVVYRLIDEKPSRIIYLSCNPVTQARDVGLLLEAYKIVEVQGYNFFPATPHIENLVVLDLA